MKYIPNVLSFSRIILSIVLFYLNPEKLPFILIYIICGITDVLDGFIARKINATSEFGAKLDSVADVIIISVILFKFIPILKLNFYMMIWIIMFILRKWGIVFWKVYVQLFWSWVSSRKTKVIISFVRHKDTYRSIICSRFLWRRLLRLSGLALHI